AAGAEAVVIKRRNRERGEGAVADLAARFPEARIALALGDMAQVTDAEIVVTAAIEKLGRIDVLVNSTGTNDFPTLLHKIALEDIPGILQRCLAAQLLSCRTVLPHMLPANSGCIINIASDAAKIPTPGETVIGAAMAGIVMFTRARGRRQAQRHSCQCAYPVDCRWHGILRAHHGRSVRRQAVRQGGAEGRVGPRRHDRSRR